MVNRFDWSIRFYRIPADINVFTDAALWNWLQFLMHHGDTFVQCIQRVQNLDLFSLIVDLAFIHVVNTKHTFHQGGFTCTIFSHQCVYRARTQS